MKKVDQMKLSRRIQYVFAFLLCFWLILSVASFLCGNTVTGIADAGAAIACAAAYLAQKTIQVSLRTIEIQKQHIDTLQKLITQQHTS